MWYENENQTLENGSFSWERKTAKGYNNFTVKKQKALAYELYGKKSAKLAYCPEMIDRGGW